MHEPKQKPAEVAHWHKSAITDDLSAHWDKDLVGQEKRLRTPNHFSDTEAALEDLHRCENWSTQVTEKMQRLLAAVHPSCLIHDCRGTYPST